MSGARLQGQPRASACLRQPCQGRSGACEHICHPWLRSWHFSNRCGRALHAVPGYPAIGDARPSLCRAPPKPQQHALANLDSDCLGSCITASAAFRRLHLARPTARTIMVGQGAARPASPRVFHKASTSGAAVIVPLHRRVPATWRVCTPPCISPSAHPRHSAPTALPSWPEHWP